MKQRILTDDEIADIVRRYTADPPATIASLCQAHHTSARIIKTALRRARVPIHRERYDPNNVTTAHIPGLDPHLTRAERQRNQHQGSAPRVGR